ncbi:MAG TPA: hypothetical protein VJR06_05470 [Nitrososphaerales archaeon]|nr:hypothetical protein [Nitrososphaerales archaeon]
MNRNLLLFSFFLILLGVGFDFYLVSFFGVLLLIPAFMAPSRTAPRPAQTTASPGARRIGPPPKPQVAAQQAQPEPQPQSRMMPPAAQPGQSLPYSPALFPTSMFPSLSLSGGTNPQPVDSNAKQPSERDELIETGAMLALLKLLFS